MPRAGFTRVAAIVRRQRCGGKWGTVEGMRAQSAGFQHTIRLMDSSRKLRRVVPHAVRISQRTIRSCWLTPPVEPLLRRWSLGASK